MTLPLESIKVVEFAGLAPGPFVGLVLADFGADVVRIDKVGQGLNADSLCRGKRSIAISPKHPKGLLTLRKMISQADIVIDPFRPGVLERLGLGPEDIKQGKGGVKGNESIIFARITGFQREGGY
jgi:alpha-methylacyl-CoA racemase